MAYDKKQARDFVTKHLFWLAKYTDTGGFFSRDSVEISLGTMAVESDFGTYLRQMKGPALGAFQVEPDTFEWLREKYKRILPDVYKYALFEEMEYDLRLGLFMCRLRYWVDPEPLPDYLDIEGQGKYYKRVYNTGEGKGSVEKYIKKYNQYVKEP